ncbi:hypothetical protein WN66_02626 [Saccharomyces cerevisiae]|uniref:Putative uncharacterized protein YGR190C n=2 Tax=Saccharomyces cerevisiae TaxID=4932 RepID=YG47_YEAST|nr:RecName: Full=Putative uncharacterized protein YGR190C [Saccharomyces cerevisiae S288C]KZV11422.1 hypothetical protein WN66_02626 [Saccharomyces cerevisiae]CAA97216.1 unnamed protein product [Saccharomyces cerevisiae]CAY79949.1 EC1118_1G1_5182p [Saccharomyces cerevisiae EC1118]
MSSCSVSSLRRKRSEEVISFVVWFMPGESLLLNGNAESVLEVSSVTNVVDSFSFSKAGEVAGLNPSTTSAQYSFFNGFLGIFDFEVVYLYLCTNESDSDNIIRQKNLGRTMNCNNADDMLF